MQRGYCEIIYIFKIQVFMLKKIKSYILSKTQKTIEESTHEKQNSELRAQKKSDVSRWESNNQLREDWDERTLILGKFIDKNCSVIEFGAGNMILKEAFNFKKYTPTDIVKRNELTTICDLNKEIYIDFNEYDVAVFSGVLEYVYDIDKVFQVLSTTINQIVMSYCCSDLVLLSRDKNGWLSDYTKNELEEIFSKYEYEIIDYLEWRNQSLFNLKKIV
jgi:hypothetical protein